MCFLSSTLLSFALGSVLPFGLCEGDFSGDSWFSEGLSGALGLAGCSALLWLSAGGEGGAGSGCGGTTEEKHLISEDWGNTQMCTLHDCSNHAPVT